MKSNRPTSVRIEFLFDDDPPFPSSEGSQAAGGDPPARALGLMAGGPAAGDLIPNAFPDTPQPVTASPPAAEPADGPQAPRPGPRLLSMHSRITASDTLRQFEAMRAQWYGDSLAPYVDGIASQLRQEAQLSERWDGLPGTDHLDEWQHRRSDSLKGLPADDRLHVWQPEVWWMAPIVRYRDTPLNMRLPLADSADALVAELAAQVPPAWRDKTVVVQVEVETRIYWGGHAPAHAGPSPASGEDARARWEPCSFRGDGVGFSEDLLELQDGEPTWLAAQAGANAPLIRRTLRSGVGLMVAVPVVTFELQPSPAAWLARLAERALRWLGLKQSTADRDPTFQSRLVSDQAWWSRVLAQTPPSDEVLAADAKLGYRLDAASGPATRHRAGAPASHGHVVLVHGGLSSVRGGFGALLDADAVAQDGQPAAIWPGLPELDACCAWRFEHDTFLRVKRNINQLIDGLERHVIGAAPTGRLVLLSHSRGGNVVRFALDQLRARWPQWEFHGLTVAAPHEGTPVFRRIGRRWSGVAHLLGFVTEAASDRLTPQQATDLALLERALAYDIPPGFRDLEPAGVARMARGRGLPAGLYTWGSRWRPASPSHVIENHFARVLEDWAGLEVDGDGVVPKQSALAGLPTARDASPSFHTGYFEQKVTVGQIAVELRRLVLVQETAA